jgi:hypothetical protein
MNFKIALVTFGINLIGIILGIRWFGWWFLVPGFLCALRISINNESV